MASWTSLLPCRPAAGPEVPEEALFRQHEVGAGGAAGQAGAGALPAGAFRQLRVQPGGARGGAAAGYQPCHVAVRCRPGNVPGIEGGCPPGPCSLADISPPFPQVTTLRLMLSDQEVTGLQCRESRQHSRVSVSGERDRPTRPVAAQNNSGRRMSRCYLATKLQGIMKTQRH